MWKCPKCGREFQNTNQEHYCGEKSKTIEEYMIRQDKDKQADLFLMRQILQQALPEAEERISWSMPTYCKKHNILHFAAAKKHIGFYPGKKYSVDKGTIRIPYGKIDADLVKRIAQWCWNTGNHA